MFAGLKKQFKFLAIRVLDRTIFTLLDNFPALPKGKYGKYLCEDCGKLAEKWDEKTLKKYCIVCIIKNNY